MALRLIFHKKFNNAVKGNENPIQNKLYNKKTWKAINNFLK